jgi:hypothetical protein
MCIFFSVFQFKHKQFNKTNNFHIAPKSKFVERKRQNISHNTFTACLFRFQLE